MTSRRRFRGQTCIYCLQRLSIPQGDHVFARSFFPIEERNNLPKVPGCDHCNNEKSRLEHYLATVMPFGARHTDAQANLERDVPGRLAQNQRLHRELREGFTQQETLAGERETVLPFDGVALCNLIAFIVKALLWHYWQVTVPADYGVKVIFITTDVEPLFANMFQMNATRSISGNIGNGAFTYEGKLSNGAPQTSMWAFSIFGGLTTTGDPDSPDTQARVVFAVTGRRDFLSRLDALFNGAPINQEQSSDQSLIQRFFNLIARVKCSVLRHFNRC